MKSLDSSAAEMIPIRLLISIVIIAAIAMLLGVGIHTLRTSLAQHQIEQQCDTLVASLDTLVQDGAARDLGDWLAPAGTTRVQTLSLPDNLAYLSFGGDPDVGNTGVLHSGLTGDGSVIFYRVDGGSKQVIWLGQGLFRFREGTLLNNTWMFAGDGESFIIDHGGRVTLVVELVQQNHVSYLLIHGNDSID